MMHSHHNVKTPFGSSKMNRSLGSDKIGFRDITEEYQELLINAEGIPKWLNGYYFKQTGAAFGKGVGQLDGLAGITSFHFKGDGKGAYFSFKVLDQESKFRYLDSNGSDRRWFGTVAASSGSNGGFMEKIKNLFSPVYSSKNLYKNANPNVVVWRLTDDEENWYPAAATEAEGTVLRFDKDTIASKGPVTTMKPEKGMIITTAAHYYEAGSYHVALEMVQQGLFPPSFEFSYGIYKGPKAPYTHVTSRKLGKFAWTSRHNVPMEQRASYMHSYAQTKNYLCLLLSSQRMRYSKLLALDFSNGFFGLFDPEPVPFEVIVFKINHDKIDTPEELTYVNTFSTGIIMHPWHQANAYEDGNTIVIDTSGTQKITADIGASDDIDSDRFTRFSINLDDGKVSVDSTLHNISIEFPQINPLGHHYKNRFAYAIYKDQGLAKIDLEKREIVSTAFMGDGQSICEPVFAPRTREKYGELSLQEEEDGVVMVVVNESKNPSFPDGHSFLAILNPSDLSEICRLDCPMVINYGLHSHWYPEDPLLCKV